MRTGRRPSALVLTVGYPGGKTRQVSVRPEQVPQVRQAIDGHHDFKQTQEAIGELNQFLLRLDREESESRRSKPMVVTVPGPWNDDLPIGTLKSILSKSELNKS